MKPNNKIRKNIRDLVDMDYVNGLSEADQEFMRKFVDEYYCGGHGKANSLHRKEFGTDYDAELPNGEKNIKQQLHDDMNVQNRDVTAIAGCSNQIGSIEDMLEDNILTQDETLEDLMVTADADELLDRWIYDLTDDLKITEDKYIPGAIKDFACKVVKLYILSKKEEQRQKRINPQKRNRTSKKK